MQNFRNKKPARTSWDKVGPWYQKHLTEDDSYHATVIAPRLLDIVARHPHTAVLDIACGQGFFSHALAKKGIAVIGVDVADSLIAFAKKNAASLPEKIRPHFLKGDAAKLPVPKNSFDTAIIVLALQNIEDYALALKQASGALTSKGTLILVLNHPMFRMPRESSWGRDEQKRIQYRRVDHYMSPYEARIAANPGMRDSAHTVSFHRPLSAYTYALMQSGFSITDIEEWVSEKVSTSGPWARAENRARKEIPLFMCIVAQKE